VIPRALAGRVAGARTSEEEHVALLAAMLTPRELEVLELLVGGASGERIARELAISPNTVRTHVQNVLNKLQVNSRLEAATFATRHGIVDIAASRGNRAAEG
jgi:two-component system nitrate/nitrite response regulator NarL